MGVYPSVECSLCWERNESAAFVSFGERLVLKFEPEPGQCVSAFPIVNISGGVFIATSFASLILPWDNLISKEPFKSDKGLRTFLGNKLFALFYAASFDIFYP